ncbi:MAG: patatin-like phospholipase family protein [Gemmatimonadales bacterium]
MLASAAIPLVFKAIEIEGEYYGDGSLRQTAPLAPAVHLGAGKILAISMRSSVGAVESTDCYPSAAQIGGLMFNSLFLDALDADAEQLQRMNRLLEGLPDSADHAGLRPVGLQLIRPSRDLGNLAHGVRVDLDPLLSFALRGIGGNRDRASDLRSYLMFHPAYTNILMELGYDDARAQEDEIRGFIES